MAHTCPDCGCQCYCGGDIDDVLLEDRDAENHCTHCLVRVVDDPDDWEGDFD